MQTQPVEDIESVLGRFQAWTGSSNTVKAKPGVRELSYEEALRSSRYRWPGVEKAPAKRKSGVETAVRAAGTETAPGRGNAAPGAARNIAKPAEKKVRAGGHSIRSAAESEAKPQPEAKVLPAAKPDAKPAFREILAEAVRPAEVVVSAQPIELARQVAISIRLAPAERALIKTRAAEAGITASAYIRQCALEVEQLRAQVRETIAALERNPAVAASLSRAGFFTRLRRRLFPRSAPALAIRV